MNTVIIEVDGDPGVALYKVEGRPLVKRTWCSVKNMIGVEPTTVVKHSGEPQWAEVNAVEEWPQVPLHGVVTILHGNVYYAQRDLKYILDAEVEGPTEFDKFGFKFRVPQDLSQLQTASWGCYDEVNVGDTLTEKFESAKDLKIWADENNMSISVGQ